MKTMLTTHDIQDRHATRREGVLALIGLLFLAAIIAFTLTCATGCATTPTAFDRAFSNVETNQRPVLAIQTNVVTLFQTNVVIHPVIVTNTVGVLVPVFQTNLVPQMVTLTNLVVVTNFVPGYTLTPNSTAQAIAQGAGTIGNAFAPGTGGLIGMGILGLLGIYQRFRNNQMAGRNDALSQSAGVLAQIIETGREIMAKTPQGKQAADAYTAWMVGHQAATDTIAQISQLVKDNVNNQDAKQAADQILAVINKTP